MWVLQGWGLCKSVLLPFPLVVCSLLFGILCLSLKINGFQARTKVSASVEEVVAQKNSLVAMCCYFSYCHHCLKWCGQQLVDDSQFGV